MVFWVSGIFMVLVTTVFMIIQMTGYGGKQPDFFFYFYQGMLVQPLLIVSYVIIYRRLKAYHLSLVENHLRPLKPNEVLELEKADK
jgi:hypothetical protein